ncbi:class I SAM-dependent methyltransferase [Luteolibacter sp. GHJ8]|uniref:Class I SAM-dependent methyltransferase n=1 Tax=Luteolibacter rhizosphaerae TaxID=2989719 RepID=A0ABT3FZR2_9BACT|nr:class I SAM-dependent methyltransferase [Luteolibacter rhizosphaerae]MCW1912751.1 class I SAM-dependent methyltransferase [Luteolibacter rhizosphaerae]
MNPAIPYTYPGIAEDLQRLRELLGLGLRSAAWTPPTAPAVLNLACGRADESGVLLSAVAPLALELFYLGIDLRPVEIAEAKSRWLPAAPPGWQLDFRAGDASRTDRMKQLPPFDLVFIRHQNYWHDPATWLVLFRNALAALKPGGVLVITSYFDREHELAMACLIECGATKLAEIKNPHARPLPDAPNKSVDRRMGVFSNGC